MNEESENRQIKSKKENERRARFIAWLISEGDNEGSRLEGVEDSNATGGGGILQRRDKFVRFINDSGFLKSPGMRWMRIYAATFFILATLLSIISFFLASSELQEANNRFHLVTLSSRLTADGQVILQKVHDLHLLNYVRHLVG